jgi:hypothetical protein
MMFVCVCVCLCLFTNVTVHIRKPITPHIYVKQSIILNLWDF